MNKYLIGGLMVAATLAIVWVGSARSQEVGMPTVMTGFLCESETSVHALLDKMEPNLDFDQAKELSKGTGCAFDQKAGIVKSVNGTYVNARGDTFAIIEVSAEDKVLYTWRLMKTATPA